MTVIKVLTNILILKSLITFLLNQKYAFLAIFFNDVDKFNRLKPQKEKVKQKKNTAAELHNEMLGIYFMNTMIYQMLKEVKWTPNMILLIKCLMSTTIVNGLEKNHMI